MNIGLSFFKQKFINCEKVTLQKETKSFIKATYS